MFIVGLRYVLNVGTKWISVAVSGAKACVQSDAKAEIVCSLPRVDTASSAVIAFNDRHI